MRLARRLGETYALSNTLAAPLISDDQIVGALILSFDDETVRRRRPDDGAEPSSPSHDALNLHGSWAATRATYVSLRGKTAYGDRSDLPDLPDPPDPARMKNLTPAELAAVAAYKPFSDSELNKDGNSLYIGFVADRPGDQAVRKLLGCSGELDDLHVKGREIYWLCRCTRMSDSKFSGALAEKVLGMRATFRNSTTVKNIAAKYS